MRNLDAIKSVLAKSKGSATGAGVDVMVFDEIDANIGGRLGDVIGKKLRQLAPDGLARARAWHDEAPDNIDAVNALAFAHQQAGEINQV